MTEFEREMIQLFLLKEHPPLSFPMTRVVIKITRTGVWMLSEYDSLVSFAARRLDGELVTLVPSVSAMRLHVNVLRCIFEELGDPRAHQHVNTWFPDGSTVQPICGPLTLMAYRASQREKATNEPA